jgi:putative toxin-antitoxin system antitoxin component (TIGR02293 family)
MFELREAAALLGVSLPVEARSSDVAYLKFIEGGFPVKALDRISAVLAPEDSHFKYRIVSKATLAGRRGTRQRLSASQSVVVARLASVFTLALRIWKSQEATREFLFRPHPALDGRPPIELVLHNEIGADLVRRMLGRSDAGVAA